MHTFLITLKGWNEGIKWKGLDQMHAMKNFKQVMGPELEIVKCEWVS